MAKPVTRGACRQATVAATITLAAAAAAACAKSTLPRVATTTTSQGDPDGGYLSPQVELKAPIVVPLSADALAAVTSASELPKEFRQLGLFAGPGVEQPLADLVPFETKVTLWSDGLTKQRYIFVPSNGKITLDAASGRLAFPVGTIAIKHFANGSTPVETRILARQSSGHWLMAAYQWTSKTTATRVDKPMITDANVTGGTRFRLPSPAECGYCHSDNSPMVLGFQPDQLNAASAGAAESSLAAIGRIFGAQGRLFAPGVPPAIETAPRRPDPYDSSLSVDLRARAYLDLNCGTCHSPAGVANFLDLTLAQLSTPYPAALLKFNRIVPGNLDQSAIWVRFNDTGFRMPPTSLYQDPLGKQLLQDWISSWPKTAAGTGTATAVGTATH